MSIENILFDNIHVFCLNVLPVIGDFGLAR